ncbi:MULTISPECIES: GTPase [Myroides]|uniref:GTPase n=1 Tax=Myroides TaxID=76831 RepID=UPI002577572F|nr:MULTISPECIES: GTPase [Myroides]MDM1377668.1 50S ribosome-binding GTPase [Myroides marinus]MDM1385128.1 50S ribosome-binding GTPase [Myroides marinus]MDM1392152.1 50S ribosome-binding GTPase [Myroides marinus]MEC4028561.1 GTPase [Myroides odoratimimus]
MNTELKIKELAIQLKKLVNETLEILEQSDNTEIKFRIEQELQELENRTDLKVAFVGQYSSGKSTIISALTGDKSIKIDANVATDTVAEYKWHNIVLMDTPGILAGKVERHDEITKAALKECDLIVYVITSQLFDDIIFDNFINLAYEQHLKDKMIIAINKMSMEAGEFEDLVSNYRQSLNSIYTERGYNFDFETIFMDAADYIEGKDDDDDEFIQLSNFSTFISSLNHFVEEKGIIKKQFDTPIRILKSGISDIALATVDPELQLLIEQAEPKIKNAKKNIVRRANLLINDAFQEIKSLGHDLTNKMEEGENKFTLAEDAFNNSVNKIVEKLDEDIQSIIEENESELMNEIESFTSKNSFESYEKKLNDQLNNIKIPTEQKLNLEKQKQILDLLGKGGSKLASMTFKDVAATGLKNVSGSTMHETVLTVGKFFGHKFKPWGAIKTANKVGNAGKFLGPLVSVAGIGLDIYLKQKEDKQRKELKEAKDKYFLSIVTFANNIKRNSLGNLEDYIKNSFDARLSELNDNKIELLKLKESNSKFSKAIQKLDSEYVEFIEMIEN